MRISATEKDLFDVMKTSKHAGKCTIRVKCTVILEKEEVHIQ